MEGQHVHSSEFGEGRERTRAVQSRRREGHPRPRQQEPRLVTGAYSYLLIFVLFHISLLSAVYCAVYFMYTIMVVSFVNEEFMSIFGFNARIVSYDFFFKDRLDVCPTCVLTHR